MQPPLPTFVIIGAQKCGTRWLRWNLSKHPEVCAAPTELHFFNNRDNYERLGVDWYREQFAGWSGQAVVGEATPGYMMLRHHPDVVASRMKATLPDAQLLAILRNPVDRALSAVVHFVKHGRIESDADVMALLRQAASERDPLGLVTGGYYARSLEPFRALYGDRLLVLFHDDAQRDARGVYRNALEHIGAAPDFVPDDLEEVVWSNAGDRARFELTGEQRTELHTYFAAEIAALEDMTGRDLGMWRTGVATSAAD